MAVRLPSSFRPTHVTAGLPGFPAVDVFAPAGTLVEAGHYGRVVRLSGRRRTGSEPRGGAYGFSVYTRNAVTGVERYMTHLECVCVDVGDLVSPRSRIGRVAASPSATPPGSDHVHLGEKRP